MTVFGTYARFYDLLYRDKDYPGEADYVDRLIREQRPSAVTLLDLGCGTGGHAALFAAKGYHVVGVDLSADMLGLAETRRLGLDPAVAERLTLARGDLRSIRLDRRFDAVVAMFHVISYQTSNQDLRQAFATIAAHLEPGGVVIFDVWYGPGVLTDPPVSRTRTIRTDDAEWLRQAEPTIDVNRNVVDVQYRLLPADHAGSDREFRETHTMRYLFAPELDDFAESVGLQIVGRYHWMTREAPQRDTWSAVSWRVPSNRGAP